jgi:hypothetical protein
MIKNRYYGKLKKVIEQENTQFTLFPKHNTTDDKILSLLQQADNMENTFEDIKNEI